METGIEPKCEMQKPAEPPEQTKSICVSLKKEMPADRLSLRWIAETDSCYVQKTAASDKDMHPAMVEENIA